jgi:hypothetical protein
LKGIAFTSCTGAPSGRPPRISKRRFLDEKVADKAVQAYFHQYEIVVTFPKSLQAVFMHMKEAD